MSGFNFIEKTRMWRMRAGGCVRIVIASFLLWLLLMAVIAFTSIKLPVGGSEERITRNRLDKALEQVNNLQTQNREIRDVLNDLKAFQMNKDGNIESVMAKAQTLLGGEGAGLAPPAAYELLRNRLSNNIQEFWFFISAQLKQLEKDMGSEKPQSLNTVQQLYSVAQQHKQSLTKVVEELKDVDGYNDWRIAEATSLSSLVQRRLHYLQNPVNCDSARKLVCSLNKGCGFGCQIHHATYCLIVAYATQRTLILSSKGWRYHKNGWEDVFKPLSDNCYSQMGDSRSTWPGKEDTQVVVLPIIDTLSPRPDYLPPSIPEDLAPRLVRLHGKPIVWWIGQMLRFLLRPQPATENFLNSAKETLKFANPIVGVHIRRTDKVGTEAAFHSLDEYMKHVTAWFEQQEYNGVSIPTKRIYLATDEPRVITEAKERYPEYEILGDSKIAKTAGMSTRYSDSSLNGILLDIHLLSLSDHLVCTFSSQVCRVAFELMQTYNPQAAKSFTSLDDVYYYGGQNAHSAVAVIAHKPSQPSEVELQVGDHVAVAGNHWDGYSKGRNLRSNQVGLYPSFKVEDRVKTAPFPTYEQVPKDL